MTKKAGNFAGICVLLKDSLVEPEDDRVARK